MSRYDEMEKTDIESMKEGEIKECAYEAETPNMLDFVPTPYSQVEVDADIRKREELKERFPPPINKLEAEQCEYLVAYSIQTLNMMGEDVVVFKTTEFDDFYNHSDMVVQIPGKDGEEPLLIAIDATQESNLNALQKKYSYSDNASKRGDLCEIKYFEGNEPESRGRRHMVRLAVPAPRRLTVWDDYVSALRDGFIVSRDAEKNKGGPGQTFTDGSLKEVQKRIEQQEDVRIPRLFLGQLYGHLMTQLTLAPKNSSALIELKRVEKFMDALPIIQQLKKEDLLTATPSLVKP